MARPATDNWIKENLIKCVRVYCEGKSKVVSTSESDYKHSKA